MTVSMLHLSAIMGSVMNSPIDVSFERVVASKLVGITISGSKKSERE